jgi:hypothetical protein
MGTVVIVGIRETESLVNIGLSEDHRGVRQPLLAEAVPSVENGLWQLFPDGHMRPGGPSVLAHAGTMEPP